jgi:Fic family protein
MLKEMLLKSNQEAARSRVKLDMISTRMKSWNASSAALEAMDAADEATTPEERQNALDKMEQCKRDAAHFKKEYKKLKRKFRELPKDPFDPWTL